MKRKGSKLASAGYLLKEGIRNIWSNRTMSLASIGVLVSCLLLTGSAVLLSMNINQMMASVEGNNSIQVYCKDEVSSLRAVQIREEIASMDNVEECELVLRDEAVEQMLEQYGDEDGALQSLLGDNFLPHAFKLSMKDLTNYQETADAIMKIDGIDKIIESRLDKRSMGFGAEIQSKKERDVGQLLKEIQPQDLLKFGIIPELVGRLPVITTLRSLGREQMVQILTEPKNSLVKQYRKLMEYDDVDLEFTPEALEAVAGRAVERGIGARGLRAILEEVMTRIMYDVPSDPEVVKVTITEDCIRSGAAPEILRDPEHSQRPALGQADLRAERGGLPGTNAG